MERIVVLPVLGWFFFWRWLRFTKTHALLSAGYNNINVGISEESLRIQTWLSPLEPYRRHQDVSRRRLDGVGDWVLQRDEFESWRKSLDRSMNSTLLCYGGQGVGKTYIRYKSIHQKP